MTGSSRLRHVPPCPLVRLAGMSGQSLLVPGELSPTRSVPGNIRRPEYVGKPAPTPYTGPEVQTAETIERDADRRPDRRAGDGGGRQAHRARGDHRRAGPVGARVHVRPRRLPLDARLPRLPQVAVHLGQRGDLPRHPGLHACCGTATSSTSTSRRTSTACTATTTPRTSSGTSTRSRGCWWSAPGSRWTARIKAVKPGRQINIIGRVIESYAKRFGYGVVRDFTGPRHQLVVPLRPDHPALRQPARDDGHAARA